MQQPPQPKPLTYTNVTQHDRIWNKESNNNFFGFNSSDALFTPPLKHITPESTQELWENFDPLDVLDSASDKSDSSADTMIMMTTEEEKQNDERVKNSFMEYELRKKLGNQNMYNKYDNAPSMSNGRLSDNGRRNSDDEGYQDDGYGTDSRSNTTASLSSPLSSSLSSLSTSESSSSQGSLQRNFRNGSKPQQIQSNGRLVVGSGQNSWVPKRKVRPVEMQDNSLEEKLRALTTIEEEDSTVSYDKNFQPQRNGDENLDYRNVNYHKCNGNVDERDLEWLGSSSSRTNVCDGFYRAVPVTIIGDERERTGMCNNRMNNQGYVGPTKAQAPEDMHKNDLHYPSPHSFISHKRENAVCDHPRRDKKVISSQHIKNTNQEHTRNQGPSVPPSRNQESTSFRDLNKHTAMMYSMPDLNMVGNHRMCTTDINSSSAEFPAVRMRNSSAGKSRQAPRPDRYSWDYSNSQTLNHQNTIEVLSQSSDKIQSTIDVPKLENQIRACSELALGIKRPVFASSKDIYKLFQGQGQTPTIQGRQSTYRHSFHAMPSTNWHLAGTSDDPIAPRPRVKHASMAVSSSSRNIGPVRANHDIMNLDGQPSAGENFSKLPNGALKKEELVGLSNKFSQERQFPYKVQTVNDGSGDKLSTLV